MTSAKTSRELRALLVRVVPFLVHTNLVQAQSLRSCGTVSTTFEYLAKVAGFTAMTSSEPGHFFNLVQTSDATWRIDLSAIQFRCRLREPSPDEYSDDAAYTAAADAYDAKFDSVMQLLVRNPFAAIDVIRIGGPRAFPADHYKSRMPFDAEHQRFVSELYRRYRRRGYRPRRRRR